MVKPAWLNRKNAVVAAVGAALVAALAWAFAPRPVEVEAATVERGHFEQGIEEDGRTRIIDRYTISAPVTARLARISLREGDRVEAGAAVAVLTPVMSAMVDERGTREAQARLKAADANVVMAAARIERARVALEEARVELLRTDKLAGEGFMAPSRLDSARLAVDGARRELDAAMAQRDVAAHERTQAAAVLQPPGSVATGQPLVVRSPVAGTVLRVPLQSEATVPAGTALLDVGDPGRLEIVAQLLTTDAVQAKPGTRVVIERWGGPPLAGTVRLVEPAAFTKISALGVEEQRVNVIIDTVDSNAQWRSVGDGFRVSVRVITASADGAVVVPIGAVFPGDDGGMAVYRIEGTHARLRPIELAGRNSATAWVRTGLAPGDRVAVYPPPSLADGKRVKVRAP